MTGKKEIMFGVVGMIFIAVWMAPTILWVFECVDWWCNEILDFFSVINGGR
jgi:hypothetical protein